MSKDYRGGTICPRDRVIRAGEAVRINADGREGIVVERMEGEYVFAYFVRFADDASVRRFKPDQITPLLNP